MEGKFNLRWNDIWKMKATKRKQQNILIQFRKNDIKLLIIFITLNIFYIIVKN